MGLGHTQAMLVERYSHVSLATADLARARWFWVDQLGFTVAEEEADRYFMVDAGTLRLRLDAVDGDVHRVGSTDPVVAFEVASVSETLAELATRDIYAHRGPVMGPQGASAELRDPDGRAILLAEQA
jgi:catechol 2,3-dioxygenase-like lactoylglutathione lyase family enzyme